VELDARAQLDRVDLAALGNLGKRCRQKRRDFPILVEGEQRLKEVLSDDSNQVCRRNHRVKRRRLAYRCHVDDAT
jgi:hypothetical protein